ncbi:MAG TPA: bifunctional glutamine-synthetase adenylyltransferase/deadenyltransferase, partial [Pedococcus sp.]|nr:bifunctional glutamine-synthetase adenylyltransferase/deadenyltransferase [Pedococcus sp.]
MGFEDAEGAAAVLGKLGDAADSLVHLLAVTADPDQAARYLADLTERADDGKELLEDLIDDEGFAMRLLLVLGASSALGDHLLHHPEQWRELTSPDLGSTRPPAFALRA